MSFTTYLFQGTPAFNGWCRENFPEKEIQLKEPSYQFEGTIEEQHAKPSSVFHIDQGTVVVTDISSSIRAQLTSIWTKFAWKSGLTAAVPVTIGLTHLLTCQTGGGYCVSNTWGNAELAILTGIFLKIIDRVAEADVQRIVWSADLPKETATHRQRAADHEKFGLPYIMKNNLKGRVLTPKEVTHLWRQSVRHFSNKVDTLKNGTPEELAAFHRILQTHCPIDSKSMEYARITLERDKNLAEALKNAVPTPSEQSHPRTV